MDTRTLFFRLIRASKDSFPAVPNGRRVIREQIVCKFRENSQVTTRENIESLIRYGETMLDLIQSSHLDPRFSSSPSTPSAIPPLPQPQYNKNVNTLPTPPTNDKLQQQPNNILKSRSKYHPPTDSPFESSPIPEKPRVLHRVSLKNKTAPKSKENQLFSDKQSPTSPSPSPTLSLSPSPSPKSEKLILTKPFSSQDSPPFRFPRHTQLGNETNEYQTNPKLNISHQSSILETQRPPLHPILNSQPQRLPPFQRNPNNNNQLDIPTAYFISDADDPFGWLKEPGSTILVTSQDILKSSQFHF